MEWVNITAKTLPEAIDLALDNLGVDEAEAELVVLEEPRQGLFGRTRGNARVKARVKPKATRPKVERGRGRKRRSDEGERSGSGKRRGRNRNQRGGGSERSDQDSQRQRNNDAAANDDGNASQSSDGNQDRRDGGRGGRDGGQKQRPKKRQRQEQTAVQEASMEEVSTHLESFMSGLTDAFGFDGAVSVINDDDDAGVVVMVEGRHGLMVGPKGRTLDAIQELARVSAQRSTPSNIRIKVDVGGYREMRREALREFAREAAEAALEDGKERSLEPMNAADRKVVHDALTDTEGVETRSAGSEPRRRVVVVPTGEVDGSNNGGPVDEAADDTADDTVDEAALDDTAGDNESVG